VILPDQLATDAGARGWLSPRAVGHYGSHLEPSSQREAKAIPETKAKWAVRPVQTVQRGHRQDASFLSMTVHARRAADLLAN